MKHHMQLPSSNKKASDQVSCCKNHKIKNQPVMGCDQKARDGAVVT